MSKQAKGKQMTSSEKTHKKAESGLSLLQGLAILGALGLIGAAIARYFAG
ncbi:hypothetical protein GCM10023337_21630 [Paenalcaligenes hermetiae]|uniref:Uncharacterized protein n=1 Tax=Paenalcaligenes hermetiae TaxID=1157987 RepID=A0ABP9ME95_9BURK